MDNKKHLENFSFLTSLAEAEQIPFGMQMFFDGICGVSPLSGTLSPFVALAGKDDLLGHNLLFST